MRISSQGVQSCTNFKITDYTMSAKARQYIKPSLEVAVNKCVHLFAVLWVYRLFKVCRHSMHVLQSLTFGTLLDLMCDG